MRVDVAGGELAGGADVDQDNVSGAAGLVEFVERDGAGAVGVEVVYPSFHRDNRIESAAFVGDVTEVQGRHDAVIAICKPRPSTRPTDRPAAAEPCGSGVASKG